MLKGNACGVEYVLAFMGTSQVDGSLEESEGADATLFEGCLGPAAEVEADPLAPGEEPIQEATLGGHELAGRLSRARGKLAGWDAVVHGDLGITLVDPDEVTIPPDADDLSEQMMGRWVVRAADFDVPVGVDAAHPTLEEREGLEGVVLDVAAGALLLAVFLGILRSDRQRRETPVLREGGVDGVRVRVVEARADNGGLEIVVTDDAGDATEVVERVLVQLEEGLELLVPDGLFVAVPRTTQRQTEHPRALPLARRRVEGRRTPKEINLTFLFMGSFP